MTPAGRLASFVATGAFLVGLGTGVFAFAVNGRAWFTQQFVAEPPCRVASHEQGLLSRSSTSLECLDSGVAGAVVTAIDGVALAPLPVAERMALAAGEAGSVHTWSLADGRAVPVAYAEDSLTRALQAAGNTRAPLVMDGLRLLAAACHVGLQLYAAWLLVRVGQSSPIARAMAGGLFAATLGLALAPSHPSDLGTWAWTACGIVSLGTLAAASVLLPRGRVTSGVGVALAVVWFTVGVVLLWPGLGKALGLPSGVRALLQNLIAVLVIAWMERTRRRLPGPAEREAMAWVVRGYAVQAGALALLVLPLPEVVLDLHALVGLRAASALLPYGVVLGARVGTHVEVVDSLRKATQVLFGTLVVSAVGFGVALLVPRIGAALGFDVTTLGPAYVEPLLVLLPGLLLVFANRERLVWAVDTAFYPARVHAEEVRTEALDALSDAWREPDVRWVLERFARAAFEARGELVAWSPTRPFSDAGFSGAELARLGRGEAVERPTAEAAPAVWLVPLRRGGELLGVLTLTCADEFGLSPFQRALAAEVGEAAGVALWRATRPLVIDSEPRATPLMLMRAQRP